MVAPDTIKPLRYAQIDHQETERLKAALADLRAKRSPMYLTLSELDPILDWKLGTQRNRSRRWWRLKTDDLIRDVTSLALNLRHPDAEYQLELRTGILTAVRGIGVSVASAILALVYPEEYAVIDYRVWRQLFGEEKTVFFIPDYRRYMKALFPLARELGWPVQEVDHAIWEYDRRLNK